METHNREARGYGNRVTAKTDFAAALPPGHLIIVIAVLYLIIGLQYAVLTPPWQVPDEPAHYNYIRYIAESGALPVLKSGDYDQSYLSQLTSANFPPEISIEP